MTNFQKSVVRELYAALGYPPPRQSTITLHCLFGFHTTNNTNTTREALRPLIARARLTGIKITGWDDHK